MNLSLPGQDEQKHTRPMRSKTASIYFPVHEIGLAALEAQTQSKPDKLKPDSETSPFRSSFSHGLRIKVSLSQKHSRGEECTWALQSLSPQH